MEGTQRFFSGLIHTESNTRRRTTRRNGSCSSIMLVASTVAQHKQCEQSCCYNKVLHVLICFALRVASNVHEASGIHSRTIPRQHPCTWGATRVSHLLLNSSRILRCSRHLRLLFRFKQKRHGASFLNIDLRVVPFTTTVVASEILQRVLEPSQILTCEHLQVYPSQVNFNLASACKSLKKLARP